MSKSMLYLVDKTLNLKKVSASINALTEEIKKETNTIESLDTAELRKFYLDMGQVKDLLEPFNSVIGVAKSEVKTLRPNYALLMESFEEFVHYSLLLVHKLETEFSKRSIDEDAEEYKEFLTDLIMVTENSHVTGTGSTVDDLFK
ncbi:MAG: hypothetical protein ACPGLV_13360 [Bacteroidia bacterium]